MQKYYLALIGFSLVTAGCETTTTLNRNVYTLNSNVNASNAANATAANTAPLASVPQPTEPAEYQARVTLRIEATGDQQKTALPGLTASVARSGNDRRMQFSMPAGGRVIYLDKAGTNYLILPDKEQYAELNRESLGFDIRRLMMPDQIVEQVKNVKGVTLIGEEKFVGRDAVRYRYGAAADTKSPAGEVTTESFVIVDKATGLPLRSETVSQSQTGVQGYKGLKIVTEISDIKTETSPELFEVPKDFQKIRSEEVRLQVETIFNSLAAFLGQIMKQ